MRKLVFATNNKHKIEEIQHLFDLHRLDFKLVGLNEIGLAGDIPEEHETLEANATAKAEWVRSRIETDCFADDTGLEIDALDGRPGVYSARYAGEGCSFADNVAKVLSGPGHVPVMWRPGGGYYEDWNTKELAGKSHDVGRQVSMLPPDVAVIQSEIENFPYQRLKKAANSVVPGAPIDPDVARRIARSLISELLLARREERDEALRSGRLLARLRPDIVNSWDSYRQRVGEELAAETRFFQDAVNDILADGEAVL